MNNLNIDVYIPESRLNIQHIWLLSIPWPTFHQLLVLWVFVYSLTIFQLSTPHLVDQFECRPKGTVSSDNDVLSLEPTTLYWYRSSNKRKYKQQQLVLLQLKAFILIKCTFSRTFSNEDGDTTEKQTRKTSVCG